MENIIQMSQNCFFVVVDSFQRAEALQLKHGARALNTKQTTLREKKGHIFLVDLLQNRSQDYKTVRTK